MNGLGKRKDNEKKKKKKSANQSPDGKDENKAKTLITEPSPKKKGDKEDPELKAKEEEQLKKQAELKQQIQELKDKLQFEQDQRQKIITLKKQEIDKKTLAINQMKETNNQLENELKTLQVQVYQNLDNLEKKEKNDKSEKDKNLQQTPLEKRLEVKEKNLNNLISVNNNYKKKKEQLQKKLEKKVNIDEINNLTDEINIAKEKLKQLEEEKEYLIKIKAQHEKCEKEKKKIEDETKKLEKDLKEIKEQNLEKIRKDRKNISLTIKGNRSIDYASLTEEEKKNLKSENIQKSIDKFWKKNKMLLENSSPEPEIDEKKRKKIEERKKLVLTEKFLAIKKKEQNIKDKINFSEKIRNEYLMSNPDEKMDKSINKNNNITELPKIPLFNQNEKKVLLNILPEKEIKKYEKRYECADIEKKNLQRKYAFETKQLLKENKDIKNKFELNNHQLKENEEKNSILTSQIEEQEKEYEKLKNNMNNMIKEMEEKKKKIKEWEIENQEMAQKLQEMRAKYEEVEKEEEEDEGDGKGEGDEEVEEEEEVYEDTK